MKVAEYAPACINDEDIPWIPFSPYAEEIGLKYLKIDPIRGEVILKMRVPAGAEMVGHHHTGTVIVYTISGAWRYQEHDWVSRAGGCVYETAGSVHKPIMEGKEDVVTFVVLQGELIYVDENNNPLFTENWKTAYQRYLDYCKKHGLDAQDLTAF